MTILWLNYSQQNFSETFVKLSNDVYDLYTILQMNMSLQTSYAWWYFLYMLCPHPYLINRIM